MSYTIRMLVENESSVEGVGAEHGLSLLIESGTESLLFDTGASDLLIRNAARLGVDLSSVGTVVISHGHYDHAGGLPAILHHIPGKVLVTGEGFFTERYSREADGHLRYTGSPIGVKELLSGGWTHKEISTSFPCPLGDQELLLITGFSRSTEYERIPSKFVCRHPDGTLEADTFADEISLCLKSPEGMHLVTGCSHPGIVNMVRSIQKQTGMPVISITGGLHLSGADTMQLERTAAFFEDSSVRHLYVSHCTGERAIGLFRAHGINVTPTHGGMVLEL